ncbi:MAG: M28 family peptidase [Thermoplasmatota archaeon]
MKARRRRGLLALSAVLLALLIVLCATILPGVLSRPQPAHHILTVDPALGVSAMARLTGLGPRLTGSKAEGYGAEYIAQEFRSAGLTGVEVLEYNVTCYEVTRASLALVQYIPGPLGLIPNPMVAPQPFEHKTDFTVGGYSGSRAHTRWTDDLVVVDVGNGSDIGAYSATGLRGVAVIATNDGELDHTELLLRAWEEGAAACVIQNVVIDAELGYPAIGFNHNARDPSGHWIPLPDNYSGDGPDIPSIMVSKAAGELIKSGIAQGSRIRMDIEVVIEKRPCRVVVGEKRGQEQPDKIIIVGAHHDTVYCGPGAVDNTVGVACAITIAHDVGRLQTRKTLRFMTFGGEEEGLLGSYEYYKANSETLAGRLEAMLNLDMSNVDKKRDYRLPISVSDERFLGPLESIRREAMSQLPELSGYEVSFHLSNLTSSSDMATFALEGYRVASCWGSGCYEYHTPKDTPEHINPDSFLLVGAVYGSFALHLAGVA